MAKEKVILQVVKGETDTEVTVNSSAGDVVAGVAAIIYATIVEGSTKYDMPPSYLYERIMKDIAKGVAVLLVGEKAVNEAVDKADDKYEFTL